MGLLSYMRENQDKGNIDISTWGKFKITDLFTISGTKTTPKDKLDLDSGGEYPYITTQATNNAVAGYSAKWTEEGGVLVVDSAVIGTCTYQEKNFTASDHVEKLTPSQHKYNWVMTKEIALFIATIINKVGTYLAYSYGKKRSQVALMGEIIYLPTDNDGKPDFEYMHRNMKRYMSDISTLII
ncbi:MAG: restriction endonuclease subunit S [Christensenellaceae bacterium]|jgi:hypothetical protein|nr:restriction endonuclease subunit S [Christensenellaceae bacterium]